MKQLSLRVRTLIISLLALTIFIPATIYTLERAFSQSLTEAKLIELRLMNLALVAAFELNDALPFMPELLYDDQLNMPDSGYIGVIVFRDKVIWQSASALNFEIVTPPPAPSTGQEWFTDSLRPVFDNSQTYFVYGYTAEFAGSSGFEPVHFFVFNDKRIFRKEVKRFLDEAWMYLSILALALLCLLLAGIEVVLKPVRTLIKDIKHTAEGRQSLLQQPYPDEFKPLKSSINQLIEAEEAQRERYKNTLNDLAHSIKTPLAVATSSPSLDTDTRQSLAQIDRIVKRQLKRATTTTSTWKTAVDVAYATQKLFNAMAKVHRDKPLSFIFDGDDNAGFFGDATDFTEMLGNLLDNACKAARSMVRVTAYSQQTGLTVIVEDDGPGIAPSQQQALLIRGNRLDTYEEGQGLGLAIVHDLVESYNGTLTLSTSDLGGVRVELTFFQISS